MATGYAAEYTANVAQDHDRSLYKPNVQLLSFISTSAGWIYPIDRFFGRALYEYYYNFEAGQERIRILYENYCNLVGSLLISACMDYKIKTTEIVKTILLVETNPTLLGPYSEYHYNYVRAAYGIDHFIYILMRYSNHFKLTCCQDEMKITEAKGSIAEMGDERRYLIYLLDVIEKIGESYLKTEDVLSKRCLPVVDEISIGPYISSCGITLFDSLQDHEYKSSITALQDASNQAKLTAHRLKQLDTLVEETSKKEVPPDLMDVIVTLTRATTLDSDAPATISSLQLDSDAPATISSSQPHLAKRSSSARLSNEEIHSDLTPTKRGLFYKDILAPLTSPRSRRLSNEEIHLDLSSAKCHLFQENIAPPPSPKSISHSPVESFKSSPSVKSKSHSPVESFKSSPSVKSKSHSPVKSVKSSPSVKYSPTKSFKSSPSVKYSPTKSIKSSPSVKSKSHSPVKSFGSSPSVKSKSHSPTKSSQSSPDQPSIDFGEITISPLLAAELIQPSFEPVQYKALDTIPDCDDGREEYLLGEYDRRLELHIVYHAMKFRTWSMTENMPSLKSVIDNQAMFEQTWPSPRSQDEPTSLFSNVFTSNITDQEGGTAANLLLEVQSLIKQIQQTVDTFKI